MATDTPPALLAQLAAEGVAVSGIWDLVNGRAADYRPAIPVLVDWLSAIEDRVPDGEQRDTLREGLIRALSVPAAKKAATGELLRQFRLVEDGTGFGLRWVVGNALLAVADDRVFDDLAAIATEPRWGPARQMVVQSLGKSKDPRVVPLLIGLLDDDDVVAHAVVALAKQKDPMARPDLERLLDHPRPLVRKEAKKALAKLA